MLPMTAANGIQPFNYGAGDNCAIEWLAWLRSFETFRKASRSIMGETEPDWISIFLFYAGSKVQQVHASIESQAPSAGIRYGPLADGYVVREEPYDAMVRKLTEFFAPKRNKTFERHIFRNMKQLENKTIDMFVIRLRQQAERCEYDGGLDDFLKDQITEGCWSSELRKKILQRKDGTLGEVLTAARISESVREENKVFNSSDGPPTSSNGVNRISDRRARPPANNQNVSNDIFRSVWIQKTPRR